MEGFLWVAFPSLVEKRKNSTVTFRFYPSFFSEIVSQIPLKALYQWAKLGFTTKSIGNYHYSTFTLSLLVQNLGSCPSMRMEHKNKCAGMNVNLKKRCNRGRGMNEGRKGTIMQGKESWDKMSNWLLFYLWARWRWRALGQIQPTIMNK